MGVADITVTITVTDIITVTDATVADITVTAVF